MCVNPTQRFTFAASSLNDAARHMRGRYSVFSFPLCKRAGRSSGQNRKQVKRVARQRKAAVRRQHMCCSQHLPRHKVGSLRQCRYNWRSCDGGSAEAYRCVQASRFVRSGNVYGVINGVKRLLSLTCKFPEHQRALCSELTDRRQTERRRGTLLTDRGEAERRHVEKRTAG